MTKQVLNRGTIANDGTGDTLRTAGLKINSNFDELYQFLGGKTDGTLSNEISLEDDAVVFEGSSTDQHEVRLKAANATADRILTLPDANGEFVLTIATQTLTNKTLTSPVVSDLTITDGGANHQYSLVAADIAANRNINLPLLTDSDEFTFNDHTQTLTNKTLTTPVISTPRITGSINDNANNELIVLTGVSSPQNHIEIVNAADDTNPQIKAVGDDANINLELHAKGTGGIAIEDKLVLGSQQLTSSPGVVDLNKPVTFLNIGTGSKTCTLANGVEDGEVKHIINRNGATWTLTITGNDAAADTVSLPPRASISLIYSLNATEWYVISNNGATIS